MNSPPGIQTIVLEKEKRPLTPLLSRTERESYIELQFTSRSKVQIIVQIIVQIVPVRRHHAERVPHQCFSDPVTPRFNGFGSP